MAIGRIRQSRGRERNLWSERTIFDNVKTASEGTTVNVSLNLQGEGECGATVANIRGGIKAEVENVDSAVRCCRRGPAIYLTSRVRYSATVSPVNYSVLSITGVNGDSVVKAISRKS